MKALKIIADILPVPSNGMIIVAFFFSFFVVKCNDTSIMSVEGIDLVMGSTYDKETDIKDMLKGLEAFGSKDKISDEDEEIQNELKNSIDYSQKIKPNVFAILAFLMAVFGFAVTFVKAKNKDILYMVLGGVGVLCLSILAISVNNKLGANDMNESYMLLGKSILGMGMGNGFYFAIAGFVLILLFYSFFRYMMTKYPEPEIIITSSDEITPDADTQLS